MDLDTSVALMIGGHVYLASRQVADTLIKTAKEHYEELNKNAIVAIEMVNENAVEMKKATFDNESDMIEEIYNLELLGFKVHYARRR